VDVLCILRVNVIVSLTQHYAVMRILLFVHMDSSPLLLVSVSIKSIHFHFYSVISASVISASRHKNQQYLNNEESSSDAESRLVLALPMA